jgi:hypothetical protein
MPIFHPGAETGRVLIKKKVVGQKKNTGTTVILVDTWPSIGDKEY